DVVFGGVIQTTKKAKPAIAPKPKVLKSSSVPEVRLPSSLRKNTKSLEEYKGDSSEMLDQMNYKNGDPAENTEDTAYIIPMCSCNFECIHKLGNGENSCKTQRIFEHFENLENIKIGEQIAPALKARTVHESHSEKLTNRNRVVLKASLLEETLKDVLTQSIFPNSSPLRHKCPDKLEKVNSSSSNTEVKIELVESSVSDEATGMAQNNHNKADADELHVSEACPSLTESNHTCYCSLDLETLGKVSVNSNITFPDGVYMKGDDKTPSSSRVLSAPGSKVIPVPKPRKQRAACLVRQDGIDTAGEGTGEPVNSEIDSAGPSEHIFKKTAKINVLGQCVSYNDCSGKVHQANTLEITQNLAEKIHCLKESTDTEKLATQNILPRVLQETVLLTENVEYSLDRDLNLTSPVDKMIKDASMLAAVDKSSFIRSSTQSMSLPKQLKLTCSQHLPTSSSFDISAQKLEEVQVKDESSPRMIPKKPKRHSLPAAGLLKKAASEELVEKSTYFSGEDKKSERILERTRLRHTSAKEQGMSSYYDLPKRSSEKPVWKLPHPILPFSGNPESLKTASISTNSDLSTAVIKPRAKSLSSVDAERRNKPSKDAQKKNSLKKFLNFKWSVCIMKSDFQKFLSKGSQSMDGAIASLSTVEGSGYGNNQNAASLTSEKKTKSAKAHSEETGSPASQKKRQRQRSQHEMPNSRRSESLDEQIFSGKQMSQVNLNSLTSNSIPEYENVCHYEEIPEYENLPFVLSSDKNQCFEWQNYSSVGDGDTNVYELKEPYEATSNQDHHTDPSAVMGEIQSDEEIMNSSDEEDDTNSDSSKGELDLQEDKQSKATGKKTKVYHIAKEIMSSEKVFFLFLGKPVIEDRILNQILYYLPQLYELNRDLLRELEERLSHWIDHQRIADIFVKKGPYLKMYSTYIKEFDKNVALLDEQCKKNPSFAAVVKDFETSPRCASLALKHYLLKPVQRIPQYRLLLTDYLKNLLEESADYKDTQGALAVVIEVANHANDIMKQGDNFQKLMQIQYSLNGHHEIVQPGRVFLKEGTLMKLSRKVMQPRMFFLFNDALLYTTPVQSGMYKLNNMLSLAGMKVRKPTQEAYQNELNIESVERSFILSASSATERDEWLEAISRSIEDYTKKRITFNPSKSLEEADPEKEEEDSPLGSKAPIWVPDTRATMCMICTSEFTLTWRRHHCRACGKIICQACSTNKHGLDYMKNQPARVCDHCFRELQKQDNQFTPKSGSPVNHKSPSSALSTVLHSIPSGRKQKKIPAALKEVSANTEDSSMSGYLYRSKGSKKPWKHLWFVIKNKVLYTYAASEDVAALESQPLLGFTVSEVKDENSESKVFHLLHKNTLFYIFKADDPHSTQK
uniref:FYVE, RhoGEF and PH domain containing 6 n=1 Tax=Pelusios castaneus TaxID=367368 RepID=A0A8C8SWY2_9SAUR